MSDETVEVIRSGTSVLCYLIRAEMRPSRTTFVTPDSLSLQLGFVVYSSGGEVARHTHRPIVRQVTGTQEVIIVREGRCLLDMYDEARTLVATCELQSGDVALLVAGGHGLRMLADTVLLEVKQGPYTGLDEKERF